MTEYFNPEIETMPREELMALQLRNLQDVVKRVYDNVPYYRDQMMADGVTPDDIKTIEDVRKLPFTTKDDMREQMPWGMMACSLDDCIEMHASSGTTGTPITVGYTRHDIEVWAEVMGRCLFMAGLRPNDIFQNPIPYGTFTGAFGFHYGAQAVGAMVVPSGMGQSERQINLMKYYKTTMFAGVVSYGLKLGQVAIEMGLDPTKDLNVKSGIFGSESFTGGLKERLAKTWDMEVYDIYGLTEMCGPGVSTDCEVHEGLHLWEDHFLVECLDPVTNEPVPYGEEGELVITTLTKTGMPVIRYKTHDLAFLYEPGVCGCGRTHIRHSSIKGRTDDMIIISGTNIFPGQIEEVLMKNPKVGTNYQIILTTENDMDRMKVVVETKEDVPESDRPGMVEDIKAQLKMVIMMTPKVEVIGAGDIKQETIKAKRVLDQRTSKE